MTAVSEVKLVGPVLRGMDSELVDAVIEAIEADNPGAEVTVDDQRGYVRIGVPNRCRLSQASLERALGRTFKLSELEPALSAFAGRVRVGDDEMVWYLEKGN